MNIPNDSMLGRFLLATIAITMSACDPGPVDHPDPPVPEELKLSPAAITLHPGQSYRFSVTDTTAVAIPAWSVIDGPGSISADGVYTAPAITGPDTLRFWIRADAGNRFGRSGVTIAPGHEIPACFERDVEPIVRANCALAGCHDPGGREGGYDFTSYLGVRQAVVPGRPEQSIMVLKISHPDEHERMPPEPRTPLDPRQIAIIRHWIADGALGAPCPGDAPCDTALVTYTATVRPLLDSRCITCHAPGHPSNGGIDLTVYQGVRAVALSGQLLGSVSHAPGYAPMPSRVDTLANCEIRQIRAWVDKGAPEN